MSGGGPLWTADAAAHATGDRATGTWAASGVSIDSRSLQPGDLFVALKGPSFDGHDFVAAALAGRAAAAMVARVPDGVAPDAPLLVVDDTFAGLQALGMAARDRTRARVVAVTGSVGKTGVKEALRLVLSRQGETHASDGSLNNHWGVPLSLSRLAPGAAFAIAEIGMNHPGEIVPLTRQVRPHVAIITTVEAVHMEHFPSVEAIADAKAEIFLGVEMGGAAVLLRDNPQFARLARHAQEAGIDRIVTFGRSAEADVRLLAEVPEETGTQVRAAIGGVERVFRIGAPGAHWVTNALGVLAAVDALGADVGAAAASLADLQLAKGRGRSMPVRLPGGSFEVIDESYNASPPSMRAAFEVLGRRRPRPGGRRIAALGDMLELGAASPALHAGLAEALITHNVDLVFTAGPLMAHLHDALPALMRAGHAVDSAALASLVVAAVRAGDIVTVKGSAGSRMRRVVDALLALDAAPVLAGSEG